MKTIAKRLSVCIVVLMLMALVCVCFSASAEDVNTPSATASETVETVEAQAGDATGSKALSAGIAVGLAALGGAIGMGMAISKSTESIARQPEAEGKIRSALMIGLVFVETAIIYALVVAILIIFVL